MRKTVLISLDALYDADLAFYDENTFIGQCLKASAVSEGVKTIFPALTYPTHVTMITGNLPDRHGVGHNQPYQPGVESRCRRWYWEHGDIRTPTLFDAVKEAGGVCASVFWPVTGKSRAIRWNLPEVVALPGENQVKKILSYGSAGWILTAGLKHVVKMDGFHEPAISDLGCKMACEAIRRHQPDLTAVHFVDLDEMRHMHGTHSDEAMAALRRMDGRVKQIWETMQATPGMENALLILVSDHGQSDVWRPVRLSEYLDRAGVKAGVQSCAMSAFIYTEDPAAAAAALEGAEGVSHVYTREELDELGCIPQVNLAVEAAPGYAFADGSEAYKSKATHGYGPGHPAERCLFAVRGKGIGPARLPLMNMTDVAPTVAQLMGISFPDCAGKAVPAFRFGRKKA